MGGVSNDMGVAVGDADVGIGIGDVGGGGMGCGAGLRWELNLVFALVSGSVGLGPFGYD